MNTQVAKNSNLNQVQYGGTGLRFLAAIIDFCIAGLAQILFAGTVVFFFLGSANYFAEHIALATILAVFLTLIYYFAFALYYAACESSPVQATPGKAVLGLKVETREGKKYGFWPAVGRFVLQWIFSLMFALIATIVVRLPVAVLESVTLKMPLLERVCSIGIVSYLVFIFVFVPIEGDKLESTCDRILGRRIVKAKS